MVVNWYFLEIFGEFVTNLEELPQKIYIGS